MLTHTRSIHCFREVQQIMNTYTNAKEVVVYGVGVPGTEGKAGMAAIIASVDLAQFDLKDYYTFLKKELSLVAMPLFLRFVKQLDTTGTHKYQKLQLSKEAFNPNELKDLLYFRDDKQATFVPLTSTLYDKIVTSQISL